MQVRGLGYARLYNDKMSQYTDELEEYRARASSGGVLPLTSYQRARRLALQKRAAQNASANNIILAQTAANVINDGINNICATKGYYKGDKKLAHSVTSCVGNIDSDSDIRPRVFSLPTHSVNRVHVDKSHDKTPLLDKTSPPAPAAAVAVATRRPTGAHPPLALAFNRSLQALNYGGGVCKHHIRSYNITSRGRLRKNADVIVSHSLSDEYVMAPAAAAADDDVTRGSSNSCRCVSQSTGALNHLNQSTTCSAVSIANTVYRVALIGKPSVGKTSMLHKFAHISSDIYFISSLGKCLSTLSLPW